MMHGRYNEQMILMHNLKSVYFEYFCQYVDLDNWLFFTIEFEKSKFMGASKDLLQNDQCTIESLDSTLHLHKSREGLSWQFARDKICYTNMVTEWQPPQLFSGRMLTHRNNNYNL